MTNRSAFANFAVALALPGNARAEFDNLNRTGGDVLALPPLSGDIPTVILVAPDGAGTAIAAFDNGKRADFARLYPQAALRDIGSGHMIPLEKPQAVVEAVEEVIRKAEQARR